MYQCSENVLVPTECLVIINSAKVKKVCKESYLMWLFEG